MISSVELSNNIQKYQTRRVSQYYAQAFWDEEQEELK
jgi:hypothetical protein